MTARTARTTVRCTRRHARRAGTSLAAALLPALAACGSDPAAPPAELSPSAAAYLSHALDLMEHLSINRLQIDWPQFRADAIAAAGTAQTPAETYPAIEAAVTALGDHHSRFFPPGGQQPGTTDQPPSATSIVSGRMLDERIAYVFVPGFGGPNPVGRADSTQAVIRALDGAGAEPPCGWVVDLRLDTGGNMYPMVAGLGPLIGEGLAGRFIDPVGVGSTWSYQAGRAGSVQVTDPYQLRRPSPPIAVLYGSWTASSGEATAISFRGLPNTRSFGTPTRGLSTGNSTFRLSDGALLVLTTVTMGDRTGRYYGGVIPPDEPVEGAVQPVPGEVDAVVRAAMDWLAAQPACAAAAG
jgi:hypothetical protein